MPDFKYGDIYKDHETLEEGLDIMSEVKKNPQKLKEKERKSTEIFCFDYGALALVHSQDAQDCLSWTSAIALGRHLKTN